MASSRRLCIQPKTTPPTRSAPHAAAKACDSGLSTNAAATPQPQTAAIQSRAMSTPQSTAGILRGLQRRGGRHEAVADAPGVRAPRRAAELAPQAADVAVEGASADLQPAIAPGGLVELVL